MHRFSLFRLVPAVALVLVSGCAGIAGYEISRTDSVADNEIFKTVSARCPEGKMPVTGGYRISDGGSSREKNYVIMVNAPEAANSSQTLANWVVHVRALDAGPWSLTAYAACVDVKD